MLFLFITHNFILFKGLASEKILKLIRAACLHASLECIVATNTHTQQALLTSFPLRATTVASLSGPICRDVMSVSALLLRISSCVTLLRQSRPAKLASSLLSSILRPSGLPCQIQKRRRGKIAQRNDEEGERKDSTEE